MCTSPDGNGSFYEALTSSAILDKWEQNNITDVACVAVDNPFSYPLSPALLHHHSGFDATLIAIKLPASEPFGKIVLQNGTIDIIEYFDNDETKASMLANTNNFVLSLNFIKRVAKKNLPYRIIKKNIRVKRSINWSAFGSAHFNIHLDHRCF